MLKNQDIHFLNEMLPIHGAKSGIDNISALQGYLTAILSCPNTIEFEQCLDYLWQGDTPIFANQKEEQRFTTLVSVSMCQDLLTMLEGNLSDFQPILLKSSPSEFPNVGIWVDGYVAGMSFWDLEGFEKPEGFAVLMSCLALWAGEDNAIKKRLNTWLSDIEKVQGIGFLSALVMETYACFQDQKEDLLFAAPVKKPTLKLVKSQKQTQSISGGFVFSDVKKITKPMMKKFFKEQGEKKIQDLTAKAEKMMWAVYEAQTRADMAEMYNAAQKALAISPFCVDAFNWLVDFGQGTFAEDVRFYELALYAGEMIYAEYFERDIGLFWQVNETRPYMRTLASLAALYEDNWRAEKAIPLWQKMLVLR